MIGILIVTHGSLAKGFKESAELIVGKIPNLKIIGLYHEDSFVQLKLNVKKAIEEMDTGDGVLVLTDLYGASPFNASAMNSKDLSPEKFRCISGLNLPILLESIIARKDMKLSDLAGHLLKVGKVGIKELFDELSLKEKSELK
ncbi:PTS sugar transporter subunit IIA [Sporolactobacillus sp. KGMB 08714]|uniref:PTS sugar transporter subunit IIA n=1 Tax=Sporolactobacillus sp. KGMB 08714 TaxID=3064704 RepID=UPI002FBE11E1